LCEADRYATALPLTLSLLGSGELLCHQAAAVLHATHNVSADIVRRAEAEVLPDANGLWPTDLKGRLVRAVLRIESETDPQAVEDRHAAAAAAAAPAATATTSSPGRPDRPPPGTSDC